MNAAAFVVGPQDGAAYSLTTLAQNAGLEPVLPYRSLAKAEAQMQQTPLVFFLCTAVTDLQSLKPMADAIRFSPSLKLRYSPIIYFARSPSREEIKGCINMGFDDVIALPFGIRQLQERIARQIGTPQTYFETSTYFGPDRRNRLESDENDPRRGKGGHFRRIEILRTPERGIEVLNDELQVVV
jgi:DNA-binding response OmpR family regulator